MTLEAYDPERLDALTLRLLDVCARLRAIGRVSRDEELASVALNDRKALEWIGKLEDWLVSAEAELHRARQKHQGGRRAVEVQARRRSS